MRLRRRLYWLPIGVLACENALFAVVLSGFAGWLPSGTLAGLLYALSLKRFASQLRDHPRPRWITRWLDTPLFWHFGASTLGLLLLPLCVVLALAWHLVTGGAFFTRTAELISGAYAFGLLVSAWTIWGERRWVRVRRIRVEIPGLAAVWSGYRIAQMSDLHVGSFDPKERALQWVLQCNALEPDLTVVTGDLVTSGSGFYADVAEALGALRAKDGVFAILGNHDQWQNDVLGGLLEAQGITLLRNEFRLLRRGSAELAIAGVDDKSRGLADLEAALRGRPSGAKTVLLSHYPSFFEAAARAGVELVLAGHTHGGQLGVPFFSQRFNLARLTRQRSRGLVRLGASVMYVNAGLGTTGPPMRLAIPPEIALIELVAG